MPYASLLNTNIAYMNLRTFEVDSLKYISHVPLGCLDISKMINICIMRSVCCLKWVYIFLIPNGHSKAQQNKIICKFVKVWQQLSAIFKSRMSNRIKLRFIHVGDQFTFGVANYKTLYRHALILVCHRDINFYAARYKIVS